MLIIDEWLNDIPQQFLGRKNIDVLIKAFAKQLQEIWQVFYDLETKLDLDVAIGQNLDYVGTIIPLSRKEAGELAGIDVADPVISDERYRQFLRYQNLVNTNECTYYDLMEGLNLLTDISPIYYREEPEHPATIILDTGEMQGYVDTTSLFMTPIIHSAGVGIRLYARTSTEISTTKLNLLSGLGFAITVTELPLLERDIDFTAPMYVKSGFQIITEDMIPEI